MSETIIDRLQKTIDLFAAYEQEIWPDQYKEAISAVRNIQIAIERICALDVQIDQVVPADVMATARQKAEDSRLALAAYQPYRRSKAIRHLQERQRLVGQLCELVEAVKVLQATERAILPVVYPAYLQVLSGGYETREKENYD